MTQGGKGKTLVVVVTKVSGDKTVRVTYDYKIPHPRYRKSIRRRTILFAHDEGSICKPKDKVLIMETRPLSKMKRWKVLKVVEAAPVVEV